MSTNESASILTLAIDVEIQNSTAIKRLKYNSGTQELQVTFRSGGTYDYDKVSTADMLTLVAYATEENSWGKGFHLWKSEREGKLEKQTRSRIDRFFGAMSPKEIEQFDKLWQERKGDIIALRKKQVYGNPLTRD